MHHAVMRICISRRLSIVCAQNEVLEGFEGEDVKIMCSNPLEIGVRGHSRSLKLVPFESLSAVSYSPSIVTMAISCIVCEI